VQTCVAIGGTWRAATTECSLERELDLEAGRVLAQSYCRVVGAPDCVLSVGILVYADEQWTVSNALPELGRAVEDCDRVEEAAGQDLSYCDRIQEMGRLVEARDRSIENLGEIPDGGEGRP